MKLLYITNGINGSGGLERVLSIKASYLADQFGYAVHIVGLNDSTKKLFYQFSEKIQLHDIAVGGNPLSYVKSYVSGLKKIVAEAQPDIILVCDDGLKAFFLPLLLGKKRPIVYERHVSKQIEFRKNSGFIKQLVTKFKLQLMTILAKRFDKLIVLTNQNASEWNSKNLQVIPNPLSFYPNESSSLTNKKVIAVGKQSHQKGFDRLLRSWNIVHQKYPDWTLNVFGKKDSSLQLEALATELKIDQSVHFYEPEKDIVSKYLESSIYVLSSRFEGFGMVLIEAMACGVPCVSYDCPFGPSDIIQHNQDGIIVENENEIAFAEAILTLIEKEELRRSMGALAKENVKRFLPDAIMQQWDELFKSVVK